MKNERIEMLSTPERVDMADAWYEVADLGHFWIKGRFHALKSALAGQDLKGKHFMEVGCGNGLIMQQFENEFDMVVDGCDLNMLALGGIGKVKGRILCLNIFDKPADLLKKYDGLLLMDVIEHIDNDQGFVETAKSYLNPDALVVINVPALNLFFSKYDHAAGHKRRYTRKMLRELFQKTGIEPIFIGYWGLTLVPLILLRKLMLAFSGNEKTIERGFKPPGKSANRLLHRLLRGEIAWLRRPFVGTSVIAVGRVKRNDR